ncbi:hypothetical protein FVF58_26065 [Paraburkholderia panacisoli]|uniref:Uncharacterized protein n=1 Tax=Paraburkholderia panacisoli TaxID=2603818 RepID=A0A5B0GUN8_9BURK|nr:hypothetical protein [Paraburkholderia panacisoli]KAA1006521.1 hypothetical protein FVF58_26065 [Paraburkholderia panacisoli]
MCINVRGFLENLPKKNYRGMFKHADGRSMTADEAKDAPLDVLAKGHNFIPYRNCNNFDFKEHGCMGHVKAEVAQ